MRLLVQKGKYQASVSTVEGTIMGRIIIIEFISLDGVVDDPDGEDGQEFGGWAFRHGPEAVAGDKFNMGELLDTCILVLGRVTWEKFSGFWPGREDEFSRKMNAMPKLVVSRFRRTVRPGGSTVRNRRLRGGADDGSAVAVTRCRLGRRSSRTSRQTGRVCLVGLVDLVVTRTVRRAG
jgi:hypothetical protein